MISPDQTVSFAAADLRRLLDGEQASVRQHVREVLSRPSFRYLPLTASIEEQREQAFRWCQELADAGVGMLAVPERYGGQGDFAAFMAAFETIAFHDLGMTIKFTVQFGIWFGSVLLLGNETQHEALLRRIGTFELPGCFAMTEIGHGSNVRELETTAVYDAETQEFVVNSGGWSGGKNYIGNGACHGRLATVFAQLETGGRRHGVHAFLVPIRGEDGRVWPGVTIEDNGPKMGENGVDNARLWFDGVRIERGALLDRYGQVDADGSYRSDIASDGARFFTTISALVGGRISIAAAGLSAAKSGLAIAVKYAGRRRQFRAPGAAEESALLDYPTHQRRLMPLLANAYALDFAHKWLVRKWEGGRRNAEAEGKAEGGTRNAETGRPQAEGGAEEAAGKREVELMAAGIKAWTTWNTTRTLQTCRECCGGEGYMSVNRLPALKADADIFTTFEGDNTVLLLWIGRQLLADAEKKEKSKMQAAKSKEDARFKGQGEPSEIGQGEGEDEGEIPRPESFSRLFQQRAEGTIQEIQRRLAALDREGVRGHEAMAQQQNALLLAAQAHVEWVILEEFGAVVKAQEGVAGLGLALRRLYELFALALLEQHRGWYLEQRLMPRMMSMALAPLVDRLCGQVAVEAEALVDAFGIPEQCLAAPIAVG